MWLLVGLGPMDGVGNTDSTAALAPAFDLCGALGWWIRVVDSAANAGLGGWIFV